ERLRSSIVRTTLGPAGGWLMKDRVVGRIPMLLGSNVEHAEIRGDRVYLKVRDADGMLGEVATDHVIAATGYKPDLRQFRFLSAEIQSNLRAVDGSPKLSSAMESSVPGL